MTGDASREGALAEWVDKLAIREVLERYMRSNDDGDAARIAELLGKLRF
jgi:hypothetical protein